MAANSSSVKSRRCTAATLSSTCCTLLAPMSVEVTRASRRTQASASCARLCPRSAAISFRARILSQVRPRCESGSRDLSCARPRAGGNAVEVPVGQQPLGQRREGDAADALPLEHVQQLRLDPAVEHRVRGLVDQQRSAELTQDLCGLGGVSGGVGRHPDIERLAGPHRSVEGTHRLLERRLGVRPVVVEDVDVVQPQPLQRCVQAGGQVLPRPEVAIGAGPHVPAGLGRDDQLVAVAGEVLGQDAAHVALRRPVGRSVVVGQVEVGDAEVERPPHHRPLVLHRLVVPEVVPEAQRDGRQLQAAAAAAAVGLDGVAVVGGDVAHDKNLALAYDF